MPNIHHLVSRRRAIQIGTSAAVAATLAPQTGTAAPRNGENGTYVSTQSVHEDLVEQSIADLQNALESGEYTSLELVDRYLARIDALDTAGPALNSVLQVNPEARAIAAELDAERADGAIRGPLHGIPVMLKDNFETADEMYTTAGSLALMSSKPVADATVVAKLREAGAIILGKTNLSEWANMRSFQASSGWSGRGGQTRNPYALDRSPSGSSSGSAVAVSANLVPVALGTETNGSIVSPASINGVVGVKPTVGLTSRAGVIPLALSQDTSGVLARTVTDAAIVLGMIAGPDDRDEATAASEGKVEDYASALDASALQGARLGIARNAGFTGYSPETDALFDLTIEALKALGAEIIDPADIPTMDALNETPGSWDRMQYEFKRDLNAYLEERGDPEIGSLADLIAFNDEHAAGEMPYFGQEIFHLAEAIELDAVQADQEALDERLRRIAGPEGIDTVLQEHELDALIAPAFAPASMIDLVHGEQFLGASSGVAAVAGYPLVTVPMGAAYGLPIGLTLMGTAFSEASLLSLAYAFEQATKMRRVPTFRPNTVDLGGAELGIDGPVVAGMNDDEGTPEATPIS